MKRIPNLITVSRMWLSLLLPFVVNNSMLFLLIFLVCGISDVLDGYLARRLDCRSKLGARLDSIADSMLFIITTYCIILLLGDQLQHFSVIIILIFIIRIANVLFAYLKYRCFLMVHTLANKVTGFCIYLLVVFYQFMPWDGFVLIALIIALLSAMEETLIHITQKTPDPDRRGIFFH